MIISRQHRLVFIHVPRTGGTSFSQYILRMLPDAEWAGMRHNGTRSAPTGPEWQEYETFHHVAFVRNPWSRVYSWYALTRKFALLNQEEAPASFAQFVEHMVRDEAKSEWAFRFNQLDYLTDETGRQQVDWIGRYECMASDTQAIAQSRGIPAGKLPHLNRASEHDHTSAYTPELRERVADLCARDLAFFRYPFDGVAISLPCVVRGMSTQNECSKPTAHNN